MEHSKKTNVVYIVLVSFSLVSEINCSVHKQLSTVLLHPYGY